MGNENVMRENHLSNELRNEFFSQLVAIMIPGGRVEGLIRVEMEFFGFCSYY
jgi:hypothetical protein